MDRPTEAQVKEFWERCGFKQTKPYREGIDWWRYPEVKWFKHLPSIDLNNLFKYAVRELRERIGYVETVRLLVRWAHKFMKEGLDPALALFWAIWGVKE